MRNAQEGFEEWLKDAYALELQAVNMYRSTAKRLDYHSEIQIQFEEFAVAAERYAKQLEHTFKALGTNLSFLKNISARIAGSAQGLSANFVDDEAVKSLLAAYSLTHTALASYGVLARAATLLNEPDLRGAFDQVLIERGEHAEYVYHELLKQTDKYLKGFAFGILE